MQIEGTEQSYISPTDLGVNAAVVANGAPVTSNPFDTRRRSQLTLDLVVDNAAATAWAVYFEHSPDYWQLPPSSRAAEAHWIRDQAQSVGAVAAGACTITHGDATWSFTTSTDDTFHIERSINAPAYRFVVASTSGTTDTALAYVTLGNP